MEKIDISSLFADKMKSWYGILLTTSFIVLLLSFTVSFIPISNITSMFISSGLFFLSLGFYVNHTQIVNTRDGGYVKETEYDETLPGQISLYIGTGLLVTGIVLYFKEVLSR